MTKVQNKGAVSVETIGEENALLYVLNRDVSFAWSGQVPRSEATFYQTHCPETHKFLFNAPVWKVREFGAMETREDVPWAREPWYQAKRFDHFAFLSVKEPGLIAYTQDDQKGARDIQTPIRAGRYLRKFFADVLTEAEIETWATEVTVMAGNMGLTITQDADEIEEVYTKGPSSCMSYSARHFDGPCHPTRVYAGPDLAIAYCGPSDGAKQRAVVWPERKVFSTIYGGGAGGGVLRELLEAAGYREGEIDGARIRKIEANYGFVMPYVDDCSSAREDGEFIRLGEGDLCTRQTNGVTEDDRATCEHCEDRCDDDDTSQVRVSDSWGGNYETWCSGCAEYHSFFCDLTDETYSDHRYTAVTVQPGMNASYERTACLERCVDEIVEIDGSYFDRDDTFDCEDCSETFRTDDMVGDYLCESCHGHREENGGEPRVTAVETESAGQAPLPVEMPTVETGEFRTWGRHQGETVWFEVALSAAETGSRLYRYIGTECEAHATAAVLGAQYPLVTYLVQPAHLPAPTTIADVLAVAA
ncbi:hypothetical protein [Sphingomonas sp.]|uniref:hypothetical protein n=1 Tax=Sphingomonas sp. TaxID=28214 RepID=UPI002ED8001B